MQNELLIDSNHEQALSLLPPATGSTTMNVGKEERIISTIAGAAAAVYGLRNISSLGGIAMTIAGGMLLSRGLSGYCMVNNAIGRNTFAGKGSAMEAKVALTINKPRAEVYGFWRRLENLPLFMKHLEEVTVLDETRSTWKAKVPGGIGTVSWESVITEDKPGELIAWSTLPGSTVDNAGQITFEDSENGFETVIKVIIDYRLPAGDVGSLAAKLFNPAVESMIEADIKRFKTIMENGESPTTDATTTSAVREEVKTKRRQSRKKSNTAMDSPSTVSDESIDENDLLNR